MRYALEARLMRVDDGEKTIDKAGCDLMLKVIKAESDQRSLLQTGGSGKKAASGSTVGDAK